MFILCWKFLTCSSSSALKTMTVQTCVDKIKVCYVTALIMQGEMWNLSYTMEILPIDDLKQKSRNKYPIILNRGQNRDTFIVRKSFLFILKNPYRHSGGTKFALSFH